MGNQYFDHVPDKIGETTGIAGMPSACPLAGPHDWNHILCQCSDMSPDCFNAVWDHVVKGERMKIFHSFDKDSESIVPYSQGCWRFLTAVGMV